tara:strand:- start:199 stop:429 length:231 start_codon:yes stop_codon:yes gene_type:complete
MATIEEIREIVNKKTIDQMIEEVIISDSFFRLDKKVKSYMFKMSMRLKYNKGFTKKHKALIKDMYWTVIAASCPYL